MNGQLITQFDSPLDDNGNRIAIPFVSGGNQLEDFLQTGHNISNTITLSNSNDKLNYRLTYTNNQQKGIVPNTGLAKNTIGLSAGYQIIPQLRADVTMNYVHTNSDNRASTGAKNADNIMAIFLKMPRNVSLNSLQQQWRDGKENVAQNTPIGDETSTGINNPYFVVYNNLNGNTRDRVYGNLRLKYDILKGLSLQIRSGLSYFGKCQDIAPYIEQVCQHSTQRSRRIEIRIIFLGGGEVTLLQLPIITIQTRISNRRK